jgi:thiamine pyrophosphate-dependent acetolactate synthase large subunit-like protein
MMLYDVYLDIDILKNPGINCFFNKELSMVHPLNPPPKKNKKKNQTNKKKPKKIQQQTESQQDKHNHKQKVIKKTKKINRKQGMNILNYGVYISLLIRYSRACSSYHDFLDRGSMLTMKLRNQSFPLVKLKSSLLKLTVATITC